MKAATHPLEAERLEALRRYDILDTPREADFDEIVALASAICEVPIAVINLIDADRQWFKAEIGLGVRSTPIDSSICAHVILESDFVEIADTQADPRMADNPLCLTEPGLRFYAGALLKTDRGLPVGTLCVLDHQPRQLTPLQRETVRVLAAQVVRQLELRAALRRQAVLRREIDHRVRNSLQTVASIVSLQSSRSADPAAKGALAAVQFRLEAIIAFHEELHEAGDGEHIDLASFLPRLARHQRSICRAGIDVLVDAAPALVSIDVASAIGMVVNEFCANAIRFAHGDGVPGTIRVLGTRMGSDYRLECSDGGAHAVDIAGLQPGRGLGLRIITASAAGHGATPVWTNTAGGLMLTLDLKDVIPA